MAWSMSRCAAQPARLEPSVRLEQLSLSFGGLAALSELDLQVGDGEIVSLIGPNGAGKTTVFNVITGVYEPSPGTSGSPGSSIAGLTPHRIARLGIARTFQSLRLFLNMSRARERDGRDLRPHQGDAVGVGPAAAQGQARGARGAGHWPSEVLSFFGQRLAGYRWDQPAYSLSYANRRRLEIARALATGPQAAAARRARRRA